MRIDNFIIPEVELPGIYGVLNVENGKMYIGSAVNLKKRLKQQKVNMRNWNGLNNLMTEDLKNEQDIFNFVFVIIKVYSNMDNFSEFEMREEEMKYIEKYSRKNLSYNVHKETCIYNYGKSRSS